MKSLAASSCVLTLFSIGASAAAGTTTAPAGVPDQIYPKRTVYEATAVFPTAFPCGGKKLVQRSAKTANDSFYATTSIAGILTSTSYTCGTETIVRSDAVPPAPTSTSYLTTLYSTSTTLCGGYEITSIRPEHYFPVLSDSSRWRYYTTTVTASKTTDIAYVCSPGTRATSVNRATFSGACASTVTPPSYPDDWHKACPSNWRALTGCPYQCVVPLGYYFDYKCFAQDVTNYPFNYNNDLYPPVQCQKCLPPCK